MHIRWNVPHDCVYDRPTRHGSRGSAVITTRHPGPLPSLTFCPRKYPVTYQSHSLIQYIPFKTHSRTPLSHDLRMSVLPAREPVKRANKSHGSLTRFHLYSSSISSASPTTRPLGALSRIINLFSCLPSLKSLQVRSFSFSSRQSGLRSHRRFVGPDIVASGAGQPAWPARYTLYGVLYHHGRSAGGGHYTVDVLDQNTHDGRKESEAWLHIDDEIVTTVRQEDVFGRHDKEQTDDRCAYLLFYRRTTSTQT